MATDRSVFERLDDIEVTTEANNKILAEILDILKKDNKPTYTFELNRKEIMTQFFKESKKSWRWLGNKEEFFKSKVRAVLSMITVLILGTASTIVTTIAGGLYSTFTLFENIWLAFTIAFMIFDIRAPILYDIEELIHKSPSRYYRDSVGMCFPNKEKVVYIIFRVLTIIAICCNCIVLANQMSLIGVFAIIIELLFGGSLVFSFLMDLFFFSGYGIMWFEGRNKITKEKVVLVSILGSNKFMSEEEFRKFAPQVFE